MDNEAGLLAEVKRRKVVRTGVVYAAAAFAILEFADIAFPRIGLSDGAVDVVLWAGLLGFPIALALAWFFDVRTEASSTRSTGWFSAPVLAAAAVLVGRRMVAGQQTDRLYQGFRSRKPLRDRRLPLIRGLGGRPSES